MVSHTKYSPKFKIMFSALLNDLGLKRDKGAVRREEGRGERVGARRVEPHT